MSQLTASHVTCTSSQAALPSHAIVHDAPAHATPLSQASTPMHVMSHPMAAVQSTKPVSHAPLPMQLTSHARPGGQVTPPLHSPAPQSMTHVPPTVQLVHAAGHGAASMLGGAASMLGGAASMLGDTGASMPGDAASIADGDAASGGNKDASEASAPPL